MRDPEYSPQIVGFPHIIRLIIRTPIRYLHPFGYLVAVSFVVLPSQVIDDESDDEEQTMPGSGLRAAGFGFRCRVQKAQGTCWDVPPCTSSPS